jgi:hypothetical protein
VLVACVATPKPEVVTAGKEKAVVVPLKAGCVRAAAQSAEA